MLSENPQKESPKLSQNSFFPLSAKKAPPATAAAPPTRYQTALSVGEPVNISETSDAIDWYSFHPKNNRNIPPAIKANPIPLFILQYLHIDVC